ncbi:MAG: Crp/Fnr family transcriptional regulator [Hyphomicrobiales bacterium]|nr:Crp/Fnr family transcriptional regulator [Hyphomicrobiales bacterium]
MEPRDLLPGISPAGRAALTRGLRARDFAKGAPVVAKGQAVSGAYFVLEGRLRVFTLAPDGKEAVLYLINPGETCILALNSLFNDLLYPAWVQAEAPTRVGVVPGPVYRGLFEGEAAVRDMTVRALSTVVFRLMDELEQVRAYRLGQRLPRFLLAHASAVGLVRMTQQEMAAHLGTTREVVAKVMGRLAAEGLVATGRGRVRLLDPPGLAAHTGIG